MSLHEKENELNHSILSGKALEAFEKFYADNVVMQENSAAPTLGKAANREREIQFFDSIAEFHGAQVLGSAVNEATGQSYSEWLLDVTFKGGQRYKLEQAVARRWENGKVVSERFYYNKG